MCQDMANMSVVRGRICRCNANDAMMGMAYRVWCCSFISRIDRGEINTPDMNVLAVKGARSRYLFADKCVDE